MNFYIIFCYYFIYYYPQINVIFHLFIFIITDSPVRRKSNFFHQVLKRSKSTGTNCILRNSYVNFENIYGVRIVHRRTKEQNKGDGFCIGIAILIYERQSNNKLRENNLTFANPCLDICKRWVEEMEQILSGNYCYIFISCFSLLVFIIISSLLLLLVLCCCYY